MDQSRLTVAFLNLGHFLDHLAMLIYATAVLVMTSQFGLAYQDMLPLSLGGFIAFGGGSLPAGWLGDRWGRRNMMLVFFLGLGAALVLAGLVTSRWQIVVALTLIGLNTLLANLTWRSRRIEAPPRERALGDALADERPDHQTVSG